MKILVIGSTGALGRPVVQRLRAQGMAALGAEVVAGDLTEPASIQRALVGVTRVLACAHGLLGLERMHGLRFTTLAQFVAARVAESRRPAAV